MRNAIRYFPFGNGSHTTFKPVSLLNQSMKRRQFIKKTLPAATIGVAGCTSGGSSNGDSGGDSDSNGDSGGGNQNTRYGVQSCASVDRLVKVRDVIFSYKGLDSRSDMYVYDVKISVKPVGGSDTIYISN